MAKIGILGGAFNPPHKGHLTIAERVRKKLNLKKVFFIPFGISPLKKEGLAPTKDRLEMVKLLIKGRSKFSILDYEIKKRKKSYTAETIKYLKRRFRKDEIFWIVGEDSFREIIEGKWKEGLKILDLIKFVVISRPPHQKKIKKGLEKVIFIKLNLPISATEIRGKAKEGKKLDNLLPKSVILYIKEKKLYGSKKNLH